MQQSLRLGFDRTPKYIEIEIDTNFYTPVN